MHTENIFDFKKNKNNALQNIETYHPSIQLYLGNTGKFHSGQRYQFQVVTVKFICTGLQWASWAPWIKPIKKDYTLAHEIFFH